ncbi:MAG: hypothetical protein E6J20_10895 [Chloroflexi bacterium]|nr:MAG: hypothetical protein E6J20_10895 [Chloroflexota bacterium]
MSEASTRSGTVLTEGFRGGAILGAFAAVFAVLGLTPSLSWIPEAPLLAIAGVVPAAIILIVGYRSYTATRDTVSGLISGATAGALGGLVGGLAYVAYGKSPVNIVAGLLSGAIAGGLFGQIGAVAAHRRTT